MREFDTRADMYEYLGGERVAEVGVWEGQNAQLILERAKPGLLLLVDHWKLTGDPTNAVMNDCGWQRVENMYPAVVRRFTKDRRVVVMRMESVFAACLVQRRFLDWVYVDASHRYDDVRADVLAWSAAVLLGGHVCGHDYGSKRHPEVTQAVDDLVASGAFEMAALTKDYPQSYALRVA